MPSPQSGNSFLWLLMNGSTSESAWKPKRANSLGATPFPMNNWRRKYRAARSSSNKTAINGIARNFERAYRAWLTNVAARNTARKKKLENEFNRLREQIRRERRVAHTPATPRRSNQWRPPSTHVPRVPLAPAPRAYATLPPNVVARARANARLTTELQNIVNALKANLRARANSKLRSPRSPNAR